ncbi:acid protease [Dendrothele bispora CBS 962.96]|uniref:Acid protease n=1 Tax=Dendrothele bispora (strain CBS 962.96) TaxID=1314807 RepID=A0A4S8MKV7_DENBC|nr:acid protease [Dendrothele bispora CBS 962.96]
MWFFSVAFLSLFVLETLSVAASVRLPRRSSNEIGRRDVPTSAAYITPVSLSKDGQAYYIVTRTGEISFRLALDTASSDIWITSTLCSTSECQSVPRYPVAYQNPTFVSVNENTTEFRASYADGSAVAGFVAKETFHVSNLTVPEQAFALISDSSVNMADDVSGIMGLGFPRVSTINGTATNSTPLFPSLAQQGLLPYPLFGLSLTRNDSGSLTFGAIDSSIVTDVDKIVWNEVVEFAPIGNENNVSSYYQWAVPLGGISVNGVPVSLSPSYPDVTANHSIAIFDVGTPGIFGPWADVSKIFASINGARLVDESGQWAIPCDTLDPMTFTIGQQNFTLLPTDYLIGPASGNPEICLSWPRAVTPGADEIDWQLGTPFLRTVYSVFSLGIDEKEPPMIGFYPLRQNTSISAATISSFLSSISVTIDTTLPNSLLATPSVTPPTYGLNSSVPAPTGGIVATELATQTYSPIFGAATTNLSALPLITPSPTVATFTTTDSAGLVSTSVSTLSVASVVLGVPPGWNSAPAAVHVPMIALMIPIVLCSMKDFL